MIPLFVLGQGLRIWDLCEVRSLSQSDPGWHDQVIGILIFCLFWIDWVSFFSPWLAFFFSHRAWRAVGPDGWHLARASYNHSHTICSHHDIYRGWTLWPDLLSRSFGINHSASARNSVEPRTGGPGVQGHGRNPGQSTSLIGRRSSCSSPYLTTYFSVIVLHPHWKKTDEKQRRKTFTKKTTAGEKMRMTLARRTALRTGTRLEQSLFGDGYMDLAFVSKLGVI